MASMVVSAHPRADVGVPDPAGEDASKRRDGNFVTGCLVGAAIATALWAAIGFAVYRLL